MTSDTAQPGEITLHGMASLENRRPAPGKPNTYIFDATFRCSDQCKDGVASLRHYIGQDHSRKLDDLYDICAKVCLSHTFFLFLICFQIVGFKPGRNLNSEEYSDEDINLLGEIRTVSFHIFGPFMLISLPYTDATSLSKKKMTWTTLYTFLRSLLSLPLILIPLCSSCTRLNMLRVVKVVMILPFVQTFTKIPSGPTHLNACLSQKPS